MNGIPDRRIRILSIANIRDLDDRDPELRTSLIMVFESVNAIANIVAIISAAVSAWLW